MLGVCWLGRWMDGEGEEGKGEGGKERGERWEGDDGGAALKNPMMMMMIMTIMTMARYYNS